MNKFLKQQWALITAFLLPLGFIAIIAGIVFFKNDSIITDYNPVFFDCTEKSFNDFNRLDVTNNIYISCNDFINYYFKTDQYTLSYQVLEELKKIDISEIESIVSLSEYDSQSKKVKTYSLREIKKDELIFTKNSPDGGSIERGGANDLDLFLFLNSSRDKLYLVKDNSKILITDQNLNKNLWQINHLGWKKRYE